MSYKNASAQYKNIQVNTANQGELILMLYRGGIRSLEMAEKYIKEKEYAKTNDKLKKAQRIIKELMFSLDLENGGEIAYNLYRLYEFFNHVLIQANINKDLEKINFVKKQLLELLGVWQQIVKGKSKFRRKDINIST